MDLSRRKMSFTSQETDLSRQSSFSGRERASSSIQDVLGQIQRLEFENNETQLDIDAMKRLVVEQEEEIEELGLKNSALEAEYLQMQPDFETLFIQKQQSELQLEVWEKLKLEKAEILAEIKRQFEQKEEEIRINRSQFSGAKNSAGSTTNSQN